MLVGCNNNDLRSLEKAIEASKADYVALESERNELVKILNEAAEKTEVQRADIERLKESNRDLKDEVELLLHENQSLSEANDLLNHSNVWRTVDMALMSTHDNVFKFVLEPVQESYVQVTYIIGADIDYNPIGGDVLSVIEIGDSMEVYSLIIYGEVYDFKWSSITWNEDYSAYVVTEIIEDLGDIINTRVNVHTTLPEGIPYQMISWKNSRGEIEKILLSYDGFGYENEMIISQ